MNLVQMHHIHIYILTKLDLETFIVKDMEGCKSFECYTNKRHIMIFVRCFFQNKNTTWRGLLEMKKCFSFLLALTLMLAVCAAASAETITLKIAHNYDFVTIPNSVIAAADRLNERYAAEGKDIKIEFEKDYQRIDWGEYGQNLIFGRRHAARPERPESGCFC